MAWFKINGQKLTAIADAIRAYTGSEATMTPDAMATKVESVHDAGYSVGWDQGMQDGRAWGHQEGYAQGFTEGQASKLFEVHKIYVSGTKTSGTHVLLEGNDFIAKNYDKPGFGIQIFYLPTYTEGNGASYAYTGNIAIPSISTGEETKNNFMLNVRDDGTFRVRVDVNVPYFDDGGNLKMTTSTSNGILKEGYYLIILSVVNIPKEVTQ